MRQFINLVENASDPAAIIQRAKQRGFRGFGGRCFDAAVAINNVIFGGRGKITGAFNDALVDHTLLGHVAVLVDGAYWDADGRPKHEDEITSWGMLDFGDPDYSEMASDLGIEWTEEAAEEVGLYEMSEEEVLAMGHGYYQKMVEILTEAKRA